MRTILEQIPNNKFQITKIKSQFPNRKKQTANLKFKKNNY